MQNPHENLCAHSPYEILEHAFLLIWHRPATIIHFCRNYNDFIIWSWIISLSITLAHKSIKRLIQKRTSVVSWYRNIHIDHRCKMIDLHHAAARS